MFDSIGHVTPYFIESRDGLILLKIWYYFYVAL